MSSTTSSKQSLNVLFLRFLPYLKAQTRGVVIVAALVVAAPVMTTGLIWSFKRLVDDVLVAGKPDMLVPIATFFVAVSLCKITVDYAMLRVEAGVLHSITLALRADLYRHLAALSPGSLGPGASTGDALTRLQGDTTRAEFLIFTGPLAILADGGATVVFVGFLFFLSWQLTLAALAALPIIVLCVTALAKPIRKSSHLARDAESHWMSFAEERLAAAQIVQAFGALEREANAFLIRCGKVRQLEVAALTLQARQSALVECVILLASMIVFGLGAHLIGKGLLTVGALVAFVATANSLYAPVRALAKSAGRLQHAAAGAQRVAAFMDQPSLVAEAPTPYHLVEAAGSVEFRNVSFSYAGGGEVLNRFSLSIAAGETIAIVGASGSGKSSLVRLLLRHYDCQPGAVLIDGVDIRNISLADLRRTISPVFQDAQILNGTIEKNIRYGAPNASAAQILEAATAAAVTSFADSRNGLSTPVGSHGSRLSGGQRQRVAVARALLHGGPILVLDEATAGVDSQTEESIQDALNALAGKRTLIVVAHRLSTVRRADRVAVLENGKIIEIGSPDALLATKSRLQTLFSTQLVMREAAE
jgi:ATP-binding cassette, subfamily B, bacterial